jgi:uncharacterized protein with HEPN domain
MRRDAERLQDILDAIDAIRSRVGADRAAFDGDAMVRVWCLHHVTVIGEAAAGLSEQFKARHQHTPWRKITGMRVATRAPQEGRPPERTDLTRALVALSNSSATRLNAL